MGDSAYEQARFVQANPLETGTLTERPTEIWVYDNYPDENGGPLRLVFIDYHSTGDFSLQTKENILAFSIMVNWDVPDLGKYQWIGGLELEENTRRDASIFDYDASVELIEENDFATAAITIRHHGSSISCG